ncbi:hypothetical protein H0H87_012861 [Tephrocybe sp. NHM501043]|nr:hypothetical protein H0H87_012861 [Tephrocybe sp. NHM501043]
MSHIQELYFPPSPSDTTSGSSPEPIHSEPHVICNPPLVAPRPLPYHSPTFLQFELPDLDQDLSHPPYFTRRTSKRKRPSDEPPIDQPVQKKRTVAHHGQSPAPHSHRPDRTQHKKRSRVYTHT